MASPFHLVPMTGKSKWERVMSISPAIGWLARFRGRNGTVELPVCFWSQQPDGEVIGIVEDGGRLVPATRIAGFTNYGSSMVEPIGYVTAAYGWRIAEWREEEPDTVREQHVVAWQHRSDGGLYPTVADINQIFEQLPDVGHNYVTVIVPPGEDVTAKDLAELHTELLTSRRAS